MKTRNKQKKRIEIYLLHRDKEITRITSQTWPKQEKLAKFSGEKFSGETQERMTTQTKWYYDDSKSSTPSPKGLKFQTRTIILAVSVESLSFFSLSLFLAFRSSVGQ
jgi:hypothetical protein